LGFALYSLLLYVFSGQLESSKNQTLQYTGNDIGVEIDWISIDSNALGKILSECPNEERLPVLNESGNKFYCAWNWHGKGAKESIQACNGDFNIYMDMTNHTSLNGHYTAFGSIIVKSGCTLYGYEDHNYQGKLLKYTGPGVYPLGCTQEPKKPLDPHRFCPPIRPKWQDRNKYANGFHSYQCRCNQQPIVCSPTDGWKRVISCDNTNSSVPTTCSYTKTIGTTWTKETTNSFHIDASIEMAMKRSFFGIMANMKVSVSTGYNWSQMSSESQNDAQEFKVQVEVPPRTILYIDNAEGDCGGEKMNTEMFKTIAVDPEGNVVSRKIERFNPLQVARMPDNTEE